MAKKIYNNPIDKNINWGGDENTGGLPVSGEMVQKFIKDTLNQKAGIFYYDTANNRYLVFSDEESRDTFLLDPTQTDLVLGTFDAPFNYSAEITLNSPAYNAIAAGSTGNYVDFTFDIKNKQGASTGENVTITYTFTRNAIRQTFSETRKYGDVVHLNVDKYLDEGTNTLVIGVTGQTSLAATTASITYQVVSLNLTDGLDISKVYDLRNGSQVVSVPYTVAGYGTKTVEWYLDGEQLPFVKAEDEVADVVGDRTKRITLENLQQGVHSLQIRAYTMLNGEKFYTDTLYRELMVYTGSNENIIIGVALTIPKDYGIFGPDDSAYICDMIQYVPYTLRFATYMSNNASNTPVLITFDGEIKGNVNSSNNIENNFVMTPTNSGTSVLTLSAQNTTRSVNAVVNATSMNIYEIDNSLVLDFNANGKSNNSADRDSWTYGDYSGSFSGFYWNDVSGWVNGRLEMNAGSSFEINYAPLLSPSTETGKTIEIEWMTKNVTDDNTVICDLRSANGTGLLITATKVSLISADGVVVETEYKSGENVRISFVINKAHGVSHQHLSFIYTNGTLSRGESWAASDNYTSNANIVFTASTGAEISLKSIRVYDTALSADNILNNYILYRDTVSEMMDVYDRNNVYIDNTTNFSPEKMMSRLPVMIVTGDIPTLENTSDTGTQIEVDIEYYNMQDPSRNFTMKKAAMRPQGTSSMGYPKKNFRIYTQKIEDTQLFDANGQLVLDKMYSFKNNAQPVDCWCLKADYAESSGTHNTGIARLWNDALYNAQVDGEYKLRTEAQKAAKEANYKYDVRTAIDGFPILLFYRPDENSELIFIGKYNFNNDKSTESVFGFTGIPNFNNEKMQCWEILNNGNALALFTSVDDFDTKWSEAFESRYPDTKTPYTGDLKAFCQWMNGVSQSDFATEKWNHLNVYMMAAYWCYLMRHAAADQFVKNAMFTSEDGQHFYFILYDNDTINGLINTGDIRINPTDDRQTVDAAGAYVFAGHDSKLWNMLEADEEFQEIVAKVDNALYSSGISYINAIKMFDEEQAGKWVERVYNKDAQYKYIDPYVETGTNNLFMLQGKRDLHRRWWLAKRFSIYDAKYISGTYKSDAIEIKCLNGTEAGQQFTIKSGYPFNYGYGINNLPRESKIFLNKDENYTFTTKEVVNVGDPIRIYGAPNIEELDLSAMSSRLSVFNVAKAASSTLGSQMKKLIVGNITVDNVELAEISGINGLTMLEYLDVQRMKNISSLNLTNQSQMKVFKGFGSGVSSVLFADGAPLERIELPSALRSLTLNHHSNLTRNNIVFENGMSNIAAINIQGCPNLCKDFNWIYSWYKSKTYGDEYSSLILDNIDWKDVDIEQLVELTNISNISLKGKVRINNITLEQANRLIEIFGEYAFNPNSEFYIEAPDAIFIVGGDDTVLEGNVVKYTCITVGLESTVTYRILSGGNSYIKLNENTGELIVNEGAAGSSSGTDIVIRATAFNIKGTNYVDKKVHITQRTYPSASRTFLYTKDYLEEEFNEYKFNLYQKESYNGDWYIKWELLDLDGYAEIDSYTDNNCIVRKLQEPETFVLGSIKVSVCRRYDDSVACSRTIVTAVLNNTIAEIDSGIVASIYADGLCANETYITKNEAALIPEGRSFTNCKSFYGFKYFTNYTSVAQSMFSGTSVLEGVHLPESITSIAEYSFNRSSGSSAGTYTPYYIYVSKNVSSCGHPHPDFNKAANAYYFDVDPNNEHLLSEEGILYSKSGELICYGVPYSKKDYVIPEWVTKIGWYAIMNNGIELDNLYIHKNIQSFGYEWLRPRLITNVHLDSSFCSTLCSKTPNIYIGKNVDGSKLRSLLSSNTLADINKIHVEEDGLLKKDGGVIYNTKSNNVVVGLYGCVEIRVPDGITSIDKNAFKYTNASKFFLSEGITHLEYVWYDNCSPSEVEFPSSLKTIGSYLVYRPTTLKKIISKAIVPPKFTVEIRNSIWMGSSSYDLSKITVEIPVGTLDLYSADSNWKQFTLVETYQPNECTELYITAEDIPVGNETVVKGTYVAITNGINTVTGKEIHGWTVSGTWETSVPINDSLESIVREISFTYLDYTAITTITHGPWSEKYYIIDKNSDWVKNETKNIDPSIYDGAYIGDTITRYESKYLYVDIFGYDTFKLYISSIGSGTSDYTMVSQLDQTINDSTSKSSSAVKTYTTTTSTTKSVPALSDCKLVTFTNIDPTVKHRITIRYYQGTTRYNNYIYMGYALIPKDQ